MTAGINDNTKFRSTIRISINSRPLFDSNAYLLKLQKYIMHKNYRTSTIFLSNNYGTHNIIEKKYITYTNSFFVFKTHADATLLCNPSNRGITYYFSHRVTTYIGVNDQILLRRLDKENFAFFSFFSRMFLRTRQSNKFE